MIGNWSSWKRLSGAARGTRIEGPAGPGIYEVRDIATGDLVAFGASADVARALSARLRQPPTLSLARLFGLTQDGRTSGDLEYRTCPAASVSEARTMAQALLGRRQAYWRRSSAQTNFAGSI